MTCSSVSPVTYSITMKKVLSCFSAVSTVTMFGWLIEARSRGSFTISLKSRFCLWGTLRATFLLIQVSSARYTEPKPPLPRGERIRYFPMVCPRSEEHTSELQSQSNLVCRLLLEKKNDKSWDKK